MLTFKKPFLKAKYHSKTLINQEILNTRDNDGNDTKIIYQFYNIDNMTLREGYLTKDNYKTSQFTQQDINDNRIYFVHQGEKTEFLFWFRIKDDETIVCNEENVPSNINYEHLLASSMANSHCTIYYPLTISVGRFTIQLINHTIIPINQGTWKIFITNSNLATKSDNNDTINVKYLIKNGPLNGYLLVNNKQSQSFTQTQIDNNEVNYIQENISNADSFMVDIYQNDEMVFNDIDIKIIVQPLVKAKKPFLTVYPGQKSLLTLDHIDAR